MSVPYSCSSSARWTCIMTLLNKWWGKEKTVFPAPLMDNAWRQMRFVSLNLQVFSLWKQEQCRIQPGFLLVSSLFSCGSECLHICQRERRNASAIVSAALLNQRLYPSSLNFRQNMRVRAKDGRLPKEGWTVAVILLSTVALMTDVYSKSTVAPGNVPAYH